MWVESFQTKKVFEEGQIRDQIKRDYCKKNGIRMIEIPCWEKNVEDLLIDKLGLTYSLNTSESQCHDFHEDIKQRLCLNIIGTGSVELSLSVLDMTDELTADLLGRTPNENGITLVGQNTEYKALLVG